MQHNKTLMISIKNYKIKYSIYYLKAKSIKHNKIKMILSNLFYQIVKNKFIC